MNDHLYLESSHVVDLLSTLTWMRDMIERYEGRLIQLGDPAGVVHSAINEAAKNKAQMAIERLRIAHLQSLGIET